MFKRKEGAGGETDRGRGRRLGTERKRKTGGAKRGI